MSESIAPAHGSSEVVPLIHMGPIAFVQRRFFEKLVVVFYLMKQFDCMYAFGSIPDVFQGFHECSRHFAQIRTDSADEAEEEFGSRFRWGCHCQKSPRKAKNFILDSGRGFHKKCDAAWTNFLTFGRWGIESNAQRVRSCIDTSPQTKSSDSFRNRQLLL